MPGEAFVKVSANFFRVPSKVLTGKGRTRILYCLSIYIKLIIPTNWKLSDRLPFLFGKACYVFRSENALYGTGHIIGRMMIMKTALLLNTL